MKGAVYIAKFLEDHNVGHVFGYPGGAILNVIQAVAATKVHYVQNFHEQASGLCADAYARIKRGVGVAMATSGPGATNLITGIANAQFDSTPTLFITGQERTFNLRKDEHVRQNGFQDMEIAGMVRSITKYSAIIMDPQRLRYELEKAWHLASSGRKGATLLDIPSDIQVAEIDPDTLEGYVPEPEPPAPDLKVAEFLAMLRAAQRPTVLVGGGVRMDEAEKTLAAFMSRVKAPLVSTLRGLDAHEDIISFSGTYGNTSANLAVGNADLLIVLGARLSLMQVGKFKDKYTTGKIVHVDIDPYEMGRALSEALSIQADLKLFLEAVLKALEAEGKPLPDYRAWRAQVLDWKARYEFNAAINKDGLDPVRTIRALSQYFSPDAILCSDVGQNQMWVAQALQLKRGQRLLNSGGHGTMGFSLPAAIGAKFAAPARQAIAFMGDGGFQINLQELQLVSQKRLGIKCIVLNNHTLGMIKDLQRYFKLDYVGTDERYYSCPNLNLLAGAYGLGYHAVTDEASLAAAKGPLGDAAPWIIEVKLSADVELFNIYRDAKLFDESRFRE
ncbi:MAG TPA: thiamine pyrophosphate-binding protein [Thermoanaerobaculia bacterium]|nr:thiamine pyrophosphate-binding protein [Thermoanaerobaculia bacterium]